MTKHSPKVSIALPNLNNYRFLEQRFQSIFDQTLTDWELIVVDGLSDDGAWELIQQYAKQDDRLRISQAPRDGIYPGINRCIEAAKGEYIYIATSDDTMDPDCLEKMVEALDAQPECGICHSCLRVIDEQGETIEGEWRSFPVAKYFGELMDVPHIRKAPYDGILYCSVYTVYNSLTQILIRRSVFEKVGLFKDDWGSEGDFEWGMKAALVTNTLHIPDELATWRVYPEQATAALSKTHDSHEKLCSMIISALKTLQQYDPEFYNKIRIRSLLYPYRRLQTEHGAWQQTGKISKIFYLFSRLFVSPKSVIDFIKGNFISNDYESDYHAHIRNEIDYLGITNYVKKLPPS